MSDPGDKPAEGLDEPQMDAAAIVAALQSADAMEEEPFRVLEAAQRRFEEIRPRLIEFLREATAAVREGREPEHPAHQYAIYLLAQFHAKEALPVYWEMLSLPDDGPGLLFGDGITEDTARILAVLADDRLDLLDAGIRNPLLDFFVRSEMAQTYTQLVLDGKVTREAAAAKLADHMKWAIENEDAEAVDFLTNKLSGLAIPNTWPLIEQAYAQGLVGDEWDTIEQVRSDFADPEATFAETMTSLTPSVRDAVEEVRRWPNFSPDGDEDDDDVYLDDELGEFSDGEFLEGDAFLDGAELGDDEDAFDGGEGATTIRNVIPRVGRNEPCPCGSGKKYKKCCGKAGD